jgi:hypothetical protein
MNISIVLIAHNESKVQFFSQMNAISGQTYPAAEVILIDTSSDEIFRSDFQAFQMDAKKQYFHSPNSYPGRSRNIGVKESQFENIAFLDMKTIPSSCWLEEMIKTINYYDSEYVFGSTLFRATSPFERLYQYCTYGNAAHETVPGTLIKKNFFKVIGDFLPKARAAEDIEWRDRIKTITSQINPNKPLLTYSSLPSSYGELLLKYIRNSFYGAMLDVLKNIKDAYLSLFIVLVFLLIPRWNYLLSDWDQSPFFIDDITKKIYFSLLFLFIFYYFLNRFLLKKRPSNTLIILKYLSYIIVFYGVYRWNDLLGDVSLSISLYIPHITKAFLSSLLIASIINRGIYVPLKNNVQLSSLFPLYWIKVGLLGCILDIIKAPIYILGSFFGLIKR